VLAGRASLPEVLQKTRFPGLTVLTSGAVPPNPSELLGSEAAKKVLTELRGGFDYVIVDSSPLLAVTDAAILAAESDGVLVIAKFATTKREQLAQAIENLKNVGARILGVIFAMSSTGKTGNYHYRYYGTEQKSSAGARPAFRHDEEYRLRHRRK
jgi:receptor protein-tyrosine kinase